MSASSKKKLRKAEQAEKLTEKQLAEQKEAKKLKIYTSVFVVVLAVMICFAAVTGVIKTIEGKGIREKNTVALTLNETELNNAELNYYYVDSVYNFFNNYGDYIYLLGIDPSVALDQQILDEETGETWADSFVTTAVQNATGVYALNQAAKEAGFTLSETDLAQIESDIDTMEMYAVLSYGYPTLEDYLKAMYGRGASEEGYREYYTMGYTAEAFQTYYAENLSYEDADLREAEADNYDQYSSYSYNYYFLNASTLVEKDESGNYTDEQYAAAVAKAEEYAKALTTNPTPEAFDAAIAALPMNAEVEGAASVSNEDIMYSSVNSTFADWVTSAWRKSGDMTVIPGESTTVDENGNESTKINGYYIVLFNSKNDNNVAMNNVRHILVAFEGGTLDEDGHKIYSAADKNAAKLEAEKLLANWKSGEATEESFAALANEKSDDGDGTTGGLYENITYKSSYVENFLNWTLEPHNPGDTGIIETEYGYHVMFYSGKSDLTYRDYMIKNDLITADMDSWYSALVEAVTATVKETKYMSTDIVLSTGN